MALKIPEAPNIVGGDAVLRSAQGISGETLTPKFKVDDSATLDAFKEVSSMIINVQKEREETMFQDAATWWTNNMNNQERNVKENIKGRDAINLYNNQMAPYAKKLEEDLFGEPKDDGLVRIADPAMQQRFKLWANKQLVQYNARIGDYEARELSKYNESTFDAREAQITSMLANADTAPEFIGGADSYAELTARRYPGLNPEYIKQVSSAKVDAAVTENIKNKIATDVVEARKFYLSNPEVSNLLTESSKAAINSAIQDQWVEQGIANSGEAMAAGDGGARLEYWTDPAILSDVFGTTDPVQINAIQQKMYGGAKKRSDALTTKAAGIADMIRGQRAKRLGKAKTDEEIFEATQELSITDSSWKQQIDAGVEKGYAIQGKIKAVQELQKKADAESAGRLASFDPVAESSVPSKYFDSDMLRVDPLKASSAVAEVREPTAYQLELDKAKQELRDELTTQTELYRSVLDDVIAGNYVGGYDERMEKLDWDYQKAIYQAVGAEQDYRNVVNRYPQLDSTINSMNTKFYASAKSRVKRILAEKINTADSNGANHLDAERIKQLTNDAILEAQDPVENALSRAITKGASEVDRQIVSAGVRAFSSKTALKAASTSDNTFDESTSNARKTILDLRSELPEAYRSVVDDNIDLFTNWYKYGNTTSIMDFVKGYISKMQSGGLL